MSDLCSTCGEEIDEDQSEAHGMCAECYLEMMEESEFVCSVCGQPCNGNDSIQYDDGFVRCDNCMS